ncbi:MAG: hypothetical protein QY309_04645 [Cyclobacteriaceae bacterium]|nr:MAG: hypothetical protein QY309_04645 [Cyclobacteriaceae bacterium]
MTTIQQQISFVEALRDSFDNNQREAMQNTYPPSVVAELLRDIHENLVAVKQLQLAQTPKLCNDCNQPVKPNHAIHFATDGDKVLVHRGEYVCERCTELRKLKTENHHTQL